MKKLERKDILDYQTYGEKRDEIRRRVLAIKEPRRVHLPPDFTFLFENRETIAYQIQEMMRIEHMVKEAEIEHEILTYNELVGGPGELGCTLMIEIDDQEERNQKLTDWLDLMNHIYMTFDDGSSTPVIFDERQVGDDRLSSVQYIKFQAGDRTPKGLKIDHPKCQCETDFSEGQRLALKEDLNS